MYTNRGRLIWGIGALAMAAALIAKGHNWAWVLLATPALLLFGYFRYGPVMLAFNAYAKRDWSRLQTHLASVAKPEWLTRESLTYYRFLSGIVSLEAGDPQRAAAYFRDVDPRALRTDNMRSKFACHRAEVALASGDLEATRGHLDMARDTPHKPDVADFIKNLEARLAAA